MSDFGPGGRGRHASPDDGPAGIPPWPAAPRQPSYDASRRYAGARATGGLRRVSGVMDRFPEDTGPLPDVDWWRHRPEPGSGQVPAAGRRPVDPPTAPAPLPPRPAGAWSRLQSRPGDDAATQAHGVVGGADADTDAHPVGRHDRAAYDRAAYDWAGDHGYDVRHGDNRYDDDDSDDDRSDDDAHADAPHEGRHAERHPDPRDWEDQTGGLEVIGAHVEEERTRRRWGRRRGRAVPAPEGEDRYDDEPHGDAAGLPGGDHRARDLDDEDLHDEDLHDEDLHDDDFYDEHDEDLHGEEFHDEDLHDEVLRGDRDDDGGHPLDDEDIPVKPYDYRRARTRRRRRRAAVLTALVVLAGVVLGIIFGGSKLLGLISPSSRDYTGAGTGSVDIRVHEGDTLSDIARTLVDADVIAGVGPFVDAAEAEPKATGIAPGVYGMRSHMSSKAALNRLLEPAARLVSRVTIPEGLTAKQVLQRVADNTGTPIADLQAAAADTATLGLPAYANGLLEGFLFPATYDFEPGTTPVEMLQAMVARAVQALDKLQIPAEQRLSVLTEASIVQAESGSIEDMGKVARVLDNRLATGMPLQLDTTVNYANGKSGVTTTAEDRANPSPYNTYVYAGLPPGPISNPGEEALKAVLAPTPGDWLFFVVVNPDTGETRFAATAEEHQQNVLIFQQWLRDHPNG